MTRPGATAHRPWGIAPYVVQGEAFSSLDALSARIAGIRRQYPNDEPFADAFLAEVVNTMHPDVVRHEYTVLRFRNTTWRRLPPAVAKHFRGDALFEGYFVPIDRWQDVTTYPWRRGSPDGALKRAFRELWARHLRPQPQPTDRCARCQASGALDYHHVAPPFDAIARAALAQLTPDEREGQFGYDKFAPARIALADFIPLAHPVVAFLRDQHTQNRWRWLCAPCHALTITDEPTAVPVFVRSEAVARSWRLGTCVSCGAPLAPPRQWRCSPCVTAAQALCGAA